MNHSNLSKKFKPVPPVIMRAIAETMIAATPHTDQCRVYQAGGSLLPHKTRDYDLVIWDKSGIWYADRVEEFWILNYQQLGFDSCTVYSQYEGADFSCSCIVKLKRDGVEYDLLYAETDGQESIMHWMREHFPLSCQCIARDLISGLTVGEVEVENIIAYHGCGSALTKYCSYYPNAMFYLYTNPHPYILGRDY